MKIVLSVFLLAVSSWSSAQKITDRDKLLDIKSMVTNGLGAGISSGVSLQDTKNMKGKITLTGPTGEKITLKCAVNVKSMAQAFAAAAQYKYKLSVEQKANFEKHKNNIRYAGAITINCSDDEGKNVVVINAQYADSEVNGNTFDITESPVGHMSMHNTIQMPPFGPDGGLLSLKQVGNKWKFSGSTSFKDKKGLFVTIFEGEAPITSQVAPTRIK